MGDSLASDDDKWGWSPHLCYLFAHDKLPFEVVNFARGGAQAAPPAVYKGPDTKNCYNDDNGRPYKYFYKSDLFPKYANAKASQPDIVILQLGLNDMVPRCFLMPCQEEKPAP